MWFTHRERFITIYIRDSVTTHATIRLHPNSPGHCLYHQVESICGIPSRLQLLIHGGKVVQHSTPISKQRIHNGSNIFLLVKGFGGGGDNTGNTQELLGMYIISLSLSLSIYIYIFVCCLSVSLRHSCT